MSEKMYPIPFDSLMNWVTSEYAQCFCAECRRRGGAVCLAIGSSPDARYRAL